MTKRFVLTSLISSSLLMTGCLEGMLDKAGNKLKSGIKDEISSEMSGQIQSFKDEMAANDIAGKIGTKIDEFKGNLDSNILSQKEDQQKIITTLQSEITKLQDQLKGISTDEINETLKTNLEALAADLSEQMQQALQTGSVDYISSKIDEAKGLLEEIGGSDAKAHISKSLDEIADLNKKYDVSKYVSSSLKTVEKLQNKIEKQLRKLGSPEALELVDRLASVRELINKAQDLQINKVIDEGLAALDKAMEEISEEELEDFIQNDLPGHLDELDTAIAGLKGTKYEAKLNALAEHIKGLSDEVVETGLKATLDEKLQTLKSQLETMTDQKVVDEALKILDEAESLVDGFKDSPDGQSIIREINDLRQCIEIWFKKAIEPDEADEPVKIDDPIKTGDSGEEKSAHQHKGQEPSSDSSRPIRKHSKPDSNAYHDIRPAKAICGNKTLEQPEECDDGNLKDRDGCSSKCLKESTHNRSVKELPERPSLCGNGKKEGKESCDDGNHKNGDGCSSSCSKEALRPIR